jgi:Ni/Co efflux regulator RcnB
MQRIQFATVLAVALLIVAAPPYVFAEKPSSEGEHKTEKHTHKAGGVRHGKENQGNAESHEDHHRVSVHFDDRHRTIIRDYFGEEVRSGHCPPGLAKKHNGCLPPGQTKKWVKGEPLSRDVSYYDLPSEILARLGLPPNGYRYVRVDDDILLLTIGTGLVIDAIENLGLM